MTGSPRARLDYTRRARQHSGGSTIRSRFCRSLLIVVLVLLALFLLGDWWLVQRSLPQLEGTISLPELQGSVTVDRDQWAIPRIQASSVEDLLVAQGYVMAQDRLGQMDILRRVAAGELAEIFGPVALPLDLENRALGLREAAGRAAASMDPETRKMVEAYARGVNRYMQQNRNRLPLEFLLLRYQPRPWTVTDTILISAFMYEVLTTTWKAELDRAKVTELVGSQRARDLFAVDSPLDHFIVGGLPTGQERRPPRRRRAAARPGAVAPAVAGSPPGWSEVSAFLAQLQEQAGAALESNNFVVSGAHTYSGKPLLANDTHLILDVPDIWYIVHLVAPGWNVKGFALPGVPFVIIGHNQRIAWGYTNDMADVQDLYIETLNPENPNEYLVNAKWVPAQIRKEIIHVKGQPDEVLDVMVTRHGPIVRREARRAYALRWTATEPGGMDIGFLLVGRAQNWNEFREAFRRVPGPAQNAVYADGDGNIGFLVGARIPVRKNGDGSVPVPGDTDNYEWTGYIPFDELPQVLNPPGGIIATANARVVGPGYRWFLTDRWAAPDRTARMYELLEGRKDLRPADCTRIQTDVVSLPDRFLADQLLRAVRSRQPRDPQTRALIAQLAAWDGQARAGSVEMSFLAYTRHELLRNLLRPYLGEAINLYVWWRSSVFLENVLRERPERWLPKPYTSYDDLLLASADQAVHELRGKYGDSQKDWRWGRVNALEMLHPMGRSGWLHYFLSAGPVEHDGSFDTVDAITRRHGPAMRFVADLSDFDRSLMELTLGQSGQYGSRHFRDQFPFWLAGRNLPAPFSDDAEKKARVHRLALEPTTTSR